MAGLRKGAFLFAVIVMALLAQLVPASIAHADGAQNCSAGQSLSTYQYYGCAYSSGTYFAHSGGQWLTVNVYINLNMTPTIPSHVVTDITNALGNWTSSQAHVVVTRVYSTNYSNLVQFVPDPCGFYNLDYKNQCDFAPFAPCGGVWGDTDDSASPHKIMLNEYRFACDDTTWTNIAAHELGHAMGLGHNTNCTPQCQLMNPTPRTSTPQSIDLSIFNTIYPSAPCSVAPGDYNCDNQDYQAQNCNHYPQQGSADNGYVTVVLEYSTNCQSNFTWASMDGGGGTYVLVKVDIERAASSSDPAMTLTEVPSANTWYTNMIWAPNNSARGCAWYAQNGIARLYGPICTAWV